MITVKVNKDKNDETYILLEQFKELVDVTEVKYYSLEVTEDYTEKTESRSIILRFYDKKKKQIKVKVIKKPTDK